jgi:hypothetical protein
MFFGECALDFVHQRIGEPGLAQCGEILADDVLPNFVVLRLLAAMGTVERPCFLHPAEEHQRMGAVRSEPNEAGCGGDGPVRSLQGLLEFLRKQELEGQVSHVPCCFHKVVFSIFAVFVELRESYEDREVIFVIGERVLELLELLKSICDLRETARQIAQGFGFGLVLGEVAGDR